jgi:hypothetical protein
MSVPGRDSTAAMLARPGFVFLVPVNVSGFRLVLARGWHGQTLYQGTPQMIALSHLGNELLQVICNRPLASAAVSLDR